MQSEFNGKLLGLIGISLLCSIIIIPTLGIATPWAVCIYVKWHAKHTIINGMHLTFDGKGISLFGNWIKWLLLSIITCGIYALWIPIKMQQWITSHTHFA